MTIYFLIHSISFAFFSVGAFAVWALGGDLFESEATMYAACAFVLIGFGGMALLPGSGIVGFKRIIRWIVAFAVAFAVYALLWSVAWFTFRNTFGEMIGTVLGLAALCLLLQRWQKFTYSVLGATAVFFLFHSLGYYTGGFAYETLQGRGRFGLETDLEREQVVLFARLAWGFFYGLGFGAGMSRLLQMSRQSSESPSTQI